jgi:hypothetical protein
MTITGTEPFSGFSSTPNCSFDRGEEARFQRHLSSSQSWLVSSRLLGLIEATSKLGGFSTAGAYGGGCDRACERLVVKRANRVPCNISVSPLKELRRFLVAISVCIE